MKKLLLMALVLGATQYVVAEEADAEATVVEAPAADVEEMGRRSILENGAEDAAVVEAPVVADEANGC